MGHSRIIVCSNLLCYNRAIDHIDDAGVGSLSVIGGWWLCATCRSAASRAMGRPGEVFPQPAPLEPSAA